MNKGLLITASVLGALAVGLGAFGAHGLKPLLDTKHLGFYQTGIQYHFYHVLAILACLALSQGKQQGAWLYRASWFFAAGIVLFSGSLYLLACREPLGIGDTWNSILGPATPIGGGFFLLGWFCLAVYGFRQSQ